MYEIGTKEYNEYWEGYNDGKRYHLNLDFSAKNEEKYRESDPYRRGFDKAGQDS